MAQLLPRSGVDGFNRGIDVGMQSAKIYSDMMQMSAAAAHETAREARANQNYANRVANNYMLRMDANGNYIADPNFKPVLPADYDDRVNAGIVTAMHHKQPSGFLPFPLPSKEASSTSNPLPGLATLLGPPSAGQAQQNVPRIMPNYPPNSPVFQLFPLLVQPDPNAAAVAPPTQPPPVKKGP